MKEIDKMDLKSLQSRFTSIKVNEESFLLKTKSGDIKQYLYSISGLPGNNDLEFALHDEKSIDELADLIKGDIKFTTGFFSVIHNDSIEVLLSPVSAKTASSYVNTQYSGKGKYKLAEIALNYYGNELVILLEGNNDALLISRLAKYASNVKSEYKTKVTATISGYNKPTDEGYVNDIRAILISVLFDFEFSYGLSYEPASIQALSTSRAKRKKYEPLPESKITFLYKKYTPELIQYLHIAEKVDYIPFKFLCYYHIVEYFADKSAYRAVALEVKKMFLKPDFHLKTDLYVAQAIEHFKKENEKQVGDKIKIERVIRQFVPREEIAAQLTSMGIAEHFSKEIVFDGIKSLKLPAINLANDGSFYSELTKRIYSTRCSIVHSNPDFDESKAVPFNPTSININKLKLEINLIAEIAKIIIVESIDS